MYFVQNSWLLSRFEDLQRYFVGHSAPWVLQQQNYSNDFCIETIDLDQLQEN